MKHGLTQVELEIRVDGGGGEAGEEVIQLAQDWKWTHGAKVVHSGTEWYKVQSGTGWYRVVKSDTARSRLEMDSRSKGGDGGSMIVIVMVKMKIFTRY